MSNKYITTVQQYGDTEDYFVEIPDEICKELNWQAGDIIDWKTDDQGVILLSKVEDSRSTQKEHHEAYYNSESEGKDTHYWYKAKEEAIKKYAS